MLVRDVMTVSPVTVSPDEDVKTVARILLERGISGVPVMEGAQLAGMISESDLQPLREGSPMRPVRHARDVMTAPVVTVMDDVTVTEAARLLQRHRIKRAPVLRDGRLVGIVTRGDLLRPYLRTDSEIRADVEAEVFAEALEVSPRSLTIDVEEGVVHLAGQVPSARARALAGRLARSVDGVVDVINDLDVPKPNLPPAVGDRPRSTGRSGRNALHASGR